MRLFRCDACGQLTYFENTNCTQCGAVLGFIPERLDLVALNPVGDNQWQPISNAVPQSTYRLCNNYRFQSVCNWLVPDDSSDAFCVACRLNRTIPDLNITPNKTLWARLETEKRRLVYSLLKLNLPVFPQTQDAEGLAFDFLADTAPTFNENGRVLTGHKAGVITLNIAEADPATREQMKTQMAEPYRTILGHFRHESGHYYWERLVRNRPWHNDFRRVFGDETQDYAQSLNTLYTQGPPGNWQEHHVSAYASAHPWEDWAETWAHYLHIVDTLETAYEFGLSVHPRVSPSPGLSAEPYLDPYRDGPLNALVEQWLPLTYALNSLNRSMGHEDAYPFVLSPGAIEKLAQVHQVIHTPAPNTAPER